MACEVELDAPPEEAVAELRAEHVQDQPPFLIEVAVEKIEWCVVVSTDDRAAIPSVCLGDVRIEIGLHSVEVLVTTELSLAVDVLHVRRKALVQPRLRP